jgi:hypothetical protein
MQGMNPAFGGLGFSTACGSICFEAVTVAQLVPQRQYPRLWVIVSDCGCSIAGVAKWQTHRT